jgi:hypothetical protein
MAKGTFLSVLGNFVTYILPHIFVTLDLFTSHTLQRDYFMLACPLHIYLKMLVVVPVFVLNDNFQNICS